MGQQHCIDIIADNHAGGSFIRELWVECISQLREERHRGIEVFHGKIDEDLGWHRCSLVGPAVSSEFQRWVPKSAPTLRRLIIQTNISRWLEAPATWPFSTHPPAAPLFPGSGGFPSCPPSPRDGAPR